MKTVTTVKKKTHKSKLQTKKTDHLVGFFVYFIFCLLIVTKHQHCPLCHFERHCLLAGDVGHSPCVNRGQGQIVKWVFKAN